MQEELYTNNKYLYVNIKALMSAFIVFSMSVASHGLSQSAVVAPRW